MEFEKRNPPHRTPAPQHSAGGSADISRFVKEWLQLDQELRAPSKKHSEIADQLREMKKTGARLEPADLLRLKELHAELAAELTRQHAALNEWNLLEAKIKTLRAQSPLAFGEWTQNNPMLWEAFRQSALEDTPQSDAGAENARRG